MISSLIEIITGLGVSIQDFAALCLIIYLFSKPVGWLIKKFFKGVG